MRFKFQAITSLSAYETRDKLEEIRRCIANGRGNQWPSCEAWVAVFPNWFVDLFGPELSQQEAEDYLNRWRKQSRAEQVKEEETKTWSFCNWIYWFDPQNCGWEWIDVTAVEPNKIDIVLEAEGWPVPLIAFDFLLRCFDAKRIDS